MSRLRIPVRYVDGAWECSFGGEVPIKEGTEAELLVEGAAISDTAFLEKMELPGRYKVLDEGTPLLVALTVKPANPPPQELKCLLRHYAEFQGKIHTELLNSWNRNTLHFVEVRVARPDEKQARRFETDRGGLWLLTQGLEAKGLASTTIRIPREVSADPVASLNHALTKLSETFETWRISHTGNIYTRVFYQERNGNWYPLDVLRNKALDKQEQAIARGLWENLLSKMSDSTNIARRK